MGSKAMYKDSPKLERDTESGKMGVSKAPTAAEKKADEVDGHTDGMQEHGSHPHDRRELAHKHIKEHMDMHHKHEMHHAMHKGDKKVLHARHHEEKKALHATHEKEMAEMHAHHESMGGREDMMEKGE